MYRIAFTFVLLLASVTINAQDFIEHLTSKSNGQGTVTVVQDSRLNDIVNGTKRYAAPSKEREDKTSTTHTGKKVKARGYRIQVYWGGSTSADQSNAQRRGSLATFHFPELQAYTSFKSPNWTCRVGDFATREEAAEFLKKMKDARLFMDATIVRSEVFVYPNLQ